MVKIEKVYPENSSKFVQYLYNPIAWVIVLTFLFGIFTFSVRSLFITPLRAEIKEEIIRIEKRGDLEHAGFLNKIEWIQTQLHSHLEWCDNKLTKFLEERPTDKELGLMLEPLRKDILAVKDSQEKIEKAIFQLIKNKKE